MPGYILHLTAAKMLLSMLPEYPQFSNIQTQENDFLMGNLLPDTTANKAASHFRNPVYHNHMMIYPDMDAFLCKYRSLLHNASCFGYYFHLYIDRKFFKDYIPQVVTFLDKNGAVTEMKCDIAHVHIKKTDSLISSSDYLSEQYYYGDFTKMNTYLVERFRIPLSLDTDIANPGIEEVDYKAVENVLRELRTYMTVPASAVDVLTVFDMEHLLNFLYSATEEFLKNNS